MNHTVIAFLNLFFAGLLAGEELVICFGVRATLSILDDPPQIRLRQALVRRLRVLVPILLGATVLSTIAALLASAGPGFAVRCAGALVLVAFILITFFGTVPINQGVLTWRPDAPPADWRAQIRRWERLDIARCMGAVAAFALFLGAVARG